MGKSLKTYNGIKVGDLIEVLSEKPINDAFREGSQFIVDSITQHGRDDYATCFYNINGYGAYFEEIRLARKKPTKLNKKLYPTWEEREGFLWPPKLSE